MDKRLTGVVVAGAVALGGLGAGLALPVVASAATTGTAEEGTLAEAVGDRLQVVRDALDGLVSDGTIDEAQADAVAEALDEALPQRGPWGPGGPGGAGGPGGHDGPGGLGRGGGVALEEAATLLGLDVDDLLARLQEGTSLAAVAAEQGVDEAALVDGLVAAAREHVAEHVAAGELTQEQADQRLAGLEERIAVLVQREDLPLRDRRGPGLRGALPEGAVPGAPGTDQEATPAPGSTTGTTGLTA